MRHHHIQMAFVHGDICRLAYRAAGMVKVRAGLRQFDKILEIFQRAKAPAPIKVHHKRAAIGGGKDHGFAPDQY